MCKLAVLGELNGLCEKKKVSLSITVIGGFYFRMDVHSTHSIKRKIYTTYRSTVTNFRYYTLIASYSACRVTTVYQGVAHQEPAGATGNIFPFVQWPPCSGLGTAVRGRDCA
jgi:hypothetical protein